MGGSRARARWSKVTRGRGRRGERRGRTTGAIIR